MLSVTGTLRRRAVVTQAMVVVSLWVLLSRPDRPDAWGNIVRRVVSNLTWRSQRALLV